MVKHSLRSWVCNKLKITWFKDASFEMLLSMQKLFKLRRGRPTGATTFDPRLARAFGAAVRERRQSLGISQEDLSSLANVERSHMGKLERGEHLPSLQIILRLGDALGVNPGALIDRTVALMEPSS